MNRTHHNEESSIVHTVVRMPANPRYGTAKQPGPGRRPGPPGQCWPGRGASRAGAGAELAAKNVEFV